MIINDYFSKFGYHEYLLLRILHDLSGTLYTHTHAQHVSFSTRPVTLPKLPASVNNLEFVQITCENQDIRPLVATGDRKMRF